MAFWLVTVLNPTVIGQESSNRWRFAVPIFREGFGRTYSNIITLAEILRKVERSQLEFCETMVFNISSSSTPTSEQFSWTFSEFFSTANFWEAFFDCRCWLTFHNLTPKAIAAPTDRISKTRSGTRIFAFAVNKVWSGGHIATHLEMNNKYDFWLPSISRDIQSYISQVL